MNTQMLATQKFVRDYVPPKRCLSHARALDAIAGRIDHAGRLRISHAELGRVLGLCPRQVQNIVHALRAAGVLRIDAWRGFANVYRVLTDWVLRLIAGESVVVARSDASVTPEPDADSSPAASSPPRHPPPWLFARHLEGHPEL